MEPRAVQAATGRSLPSAASALDRLVPAVSTAGTLLPGLLSLVFGGVIAARRLGGAAPVPPGPAALVLSCAVGMVLVWLADLAARPGPAVRAAGPLLARLGMLGSVAAVALPPRWSTPGDGIALALAAICAATAVLRWRPAARERGHRPPPTRLPSRSVPVDTADLAPAPATDPAAHRGATPAADEGASGGGSVSQRFERVVLPDGSECIRGRLHVTVAAGARAGAGHVGFCPPLPAVPLVQVSTDYDAVEAIVTAAEVLPWGVRVECRLDEPADEAIEIPVDLAARTSS